MIEDKRHQLDGLKLSDILSYCGCRAFTTEEYIRGANKQIANLEAQIEKMKCCENCNNFKHRIDHRCNTKCKNLSEWEIKENDR